MFPIFKTFESIFKARLAGIIVSCAVLALFVVGLLVWGVTWLTSDFVHLQTPWMDTAVDWIAGIITGIGGWFMLPALIVLIAGIFQEFIIHKVEKAYYPQNLRSTPPAMWPDVWHDISFTCWALFLNILVLPFYFLAIGFFVSIVLNSYLLGREFFELTAGYHLGKKEARKLGRKNRLAVYGGGFIITLATLVPFLNILVPVLAVVWMIHVYHWLKQD